jgi:hypothetical protein
MLATPAATHQAIPLQSEPVWVRTTARTFQPVFTSPSAPSPEIFGTSIDGCADPETTEKAATMIINVRCGSRDSRPHIFRLLTGQEHAGRPLLPLDFQLFSPKKSGIPVTKKSFEKSF